MSFINPPVGLVQSSHQARYVHWEPNGAWPSGEIHTCPATEGFAPFVIFLPWPSSVGFAADPAGMEWFSADFTDLSYAPYYALRVLLRGPNALGQWFDPPACVAPPQNYGLDGPNAIVSLDGTLVAPDGSSIPSSVSASDDDAQSLKVEGYLINPAPVWPSPDADGNTFGSVLWTAAQIATVTGDIWVERGPATGSGTNNGLAVTLRPYFTDDAVPVEAVGDEEIHVIGSA